MKKLCTVAFVLCIVFGAAFMGGCEYYNLSLKNPTEEALAGVTAEGHEVRSDFVTWLDGTVVIPPGEESVVAVQLKNPGGWLMDLAWADPQLGNVTFKQNSSTEVLITIVGAKIGDTFNLALNIQDTDGPQIPNQYQLPPIVCYSFNAELEKVIVDNGTVKRETPMPGYAEATILVPYVVESATITGIPQDEHATIQGGVSNKSVILGLNAPVKLRVIAQNKVTSKDYTIQVMRGTSYVLFDNGVCTITFYKPSDEIIELEAENLFLSWIEDTLLRIIIKDPVPGYMYQWFLDDKPTEFLEPVYETLSAQDLVTGRHWVTSKVWTPAGVLYSSQTVAFTVK
jgi:hypothetical protein